MHDQDPPVTLTTPLGQRFRLEDPGARKRIVRFTTLWIEAGGDLDAPEAFTLAYYMARRADLDPTPGQPHAEAERDALIRYLIDRARTEGDVLPAASKP